MGTDNSAVQEVFEALAEKISKSSVDFEGPETIDSRFEVRGISSDSPAVQDMFLKLQDKIRERSST